MQRHGQPPTVARDEFGLRVAIGGLVTGKLDAAFAGGGVRGGVLGFGREQFQDGDDVKEFALEKSTWSINVGAGVKLINHIQAAVNYNIPVSKEGAYRLYEDQTVANAANAANEAGESIKASTLQFSLTWTF